MSFIFEIYRRFRCCCFLKTFPRPALLPFSRPLSSRLFRRKHEACKAFDRQLARKIKHLLICLRQAVPEPRCSTRHNNMGISFARWQTWASSLPVVDHLYRSASCFQLPVKSRALLILRVLELEASNAVSFHYKKTTKNKQTKNNKKQTQLVLLFDYEVLEFI